MRFSTFILAAALVAGCSPGAQTAPPVAGGAHAASASRATASFGNTTTVDTITYDVKLEVGPPTSNCDQASHPTVPCFWISNSPDGSLTQSVGVAVGDTVRLQPQSGGPIAIGDILTATNSAGGYVSLSNNLNHALVITGVNPGDEAVTIVDNTNGVSVTLPVGVPRPSYCDVGCLPSPHPSP